MRGFIFTFFLNVDSYSFVRLIFVFLVLLVPLFAFISGFTIYKRRIESNKKLWQQKIAPIISEAIFFKDGEKERADLLSIGYKIEVLLQNSRFRQYVIDELIQVKKNLSGSSNLNLNKLFEILELDRDSLRKLHKKKCHVKAKGIHELGIMGQVKYTKEIFRLVNNTDELVRNEAQSALVSFYGFPGLRFLDLTEYPISQWQQIQLLNKLIGVKVTEFDIIKKWLQSSNESVLVLSLKLATFYNCHDVYDSVINCLQSSNPQVKLNVLEYLKKMPQEDTAEQIISHYSFENKEYKLSVIDALKEIGSEKQISFLLTQLHDKDDDLKAAAAKSLSCLDPFGNVFLKNRLFADEYPWKAIFLQIHNERAV